MKFSLTRTLTVLSRNSALVSVQWHLLIGSAFRWKPNLCYIVAISVGFFSHSDNDLLIYDTLSYRGRRQVSRAESITVKSHMPSHPVWVLNSY